MRPLSGAPGGVRHGGMPDPRVPETSHRDSAPITLGGRERSLEHRAPVAEPLGRTLQKGMIDKGLMHRQ